MRQIIIYITITVIIITISSITIYTTVIIITTIIIITLIKQQETHRQLVALRVQQGVLQDPPVFDDSARTLATTTCNISSSIILIY